MCFKRAIKTYVRAIEDLMQARIQLEAQHSSEQKRSHRHCAILLGPDRAQVARRQVS